MNKTIKYSVTAIVLGLSLVGCSNKIISMNDSHQVNDLRDLDHDGVIEAREHCSNTILGSSVDNDGCGSKSEFIVRQDLHINFINDSATIAPQYQGQIAQLADFMKKYPVSKVTIEGHSSKVGGYNYNIALSQRRANNVASDLESHFGIAANRIKAVGYGYTHLLDNGTTELAHQKNRRIVAAVSGLDQKVDYKWTIYTKN
ncbi:OmpA family protein [Photobacterium piscicola]|uniref:OmpA family protein n=1 Tax=Photobacterium piscicola TaxID=1378299 RepID=A0ABU6LKG7_9GAMM|nr:OmpA family protein [Photobacterium piscicola]MEC6882256.1 OmpA family protein [Photobacterium piscicola]MEC6899802.1 OmpA family protein [Photobacterium piscicola]